MKTNQNGFAAVLVILIAAVVLAGVGAYFYVTQTAKPKQGEVAAQPVTQTAASGSADLRIYRNDRWGFEIGLPAGWAYNSNESSDTSVVYSAKATNDNSTAQGIVLTLMSAESIDSLVEKTKNNIAGLDKVEKIEISGRPAAIMESHYAGSSVAKQLKSSAGYYISLPKPIAVKSKEYNFIYVGLSQADKSIISTFKFIDAQTTVAKTEIVTYQPHRDGVTQYKTISGDCLVGSEAANRTDAYRCITSNEISDPCFVLPNEKLLICGVDIVTANGGFLLQPAKALPKGELWKNNIQGWAMRLQLISGEICSFMGGATAGNAKNERLNYQCGDNKNLSMAIYGDLTEGDVWTANVSNIEYDAAGKVWNVLSAKTVDIAKLWR